MTKMLTQILALIFATIVLLGVMPTVSAFPDPFDEPYMIQDWGRRGVWEPLNGELTSGNPIVLSRPDPTRLTQFWITRNIAGGRRIVNAAAPDYIFADWHGLEWFNATLIISREPANTQMWFTYSPTDAPDFKINAMSPDHHCVRGYGEGFQLNLVSCSSADLTPFQRWFMNKNYTIPTN